jgi:hypothetical protein
LVSCAKQAVATNSAKRDVRSFFMRRNIITGTGNDNGDCVCRRQREEALSFAENNMEPPHIGTDAEFDATCVGLVASGFRNRKITNP